MKFITQLLNILKRKTPSKEYIPNIQTDSTENDHETQSQPKKEEVKKETPTPSLEEQTSDHLKNVMEDQGYTVHIIEHISSRLESNQKGEMFENYYKLVHYSNPNSSTIHCMIQPVGKPVV